MILKRTWRPDLSSAARLTLLAIALGVLPWTPRAFSQSGPSPDDPQKPASAAKNAEPAEPSTAAEPETAPASTPQQNVPAGAAQASPPSRRGGYVLSETGVATPAGPVGQRIDYRDPGAVAQDPKPTIEERLDRLESMLNRLMTEKLNPLTQKDAAYQDFYNAPSVQMKAEGKRQLQGNRGGGVGSGVTWPVLKTAPPPPAQPTLPYDTVGSRLLTLQGKTADPDAANAAIKHKLVDLEFEIKSLQLQLDRAHAQREILEKQLKESSDDSTSPSTSGQPARTAPTTAPRQ
jgi:hypothetical protein